MPYDGLASFDPELFLDPAQESAIGTNPRQMTVEHACNGYRCRNVSLSGAVFFEGYEDVVGEKWR
jgi:hypothetical protein